MTLAASETLLTTDNITAPNNDSLSASIYVDTNDLDNDAGTDSFVTAGWASLFGTWPNSTEADLLRLTFDINENVGNTDDSVSVTNPADFSGPFGGATVGEGSLFTFPSSGTESWAGFANVNTSLYPISISQAGTLTFNASVPSGVSADLYFRFEKNPYPDVEPSFNTAHVTVTGSETASYSVELPAQADKTFSSFLMYVVDKDIGVVVTDVILSVD
jgi:hypothetical protein